MAIAQVLVHLYCVALIIKNLSEFPSTRLDLHISTGFSFSGIESKNTNEHGAVSRKSTRKLTKIRAGSSSNRYTTLMDVCTFIFIDFRQREWRKSHLEMRKSENELRNNVSLSHFRVALSYRLCVSKCTFEFFSCMIFLNYVIRIARVQLRHFPACFVCMHAAYVLSFLFLIRRIML